MKQALNEKEERFVGDLMEWDRDRSAFERIVYHIFLLLVGAVIVGTIVLTVPHPNDHTVIWVTLPGTFVGLLFGAVYGLGERRIAYRRTVASVLRKLSADT
ncbi:MAG: hypothetical protein QGH20_07815 [Candidatus Latescibacteria bacterium]|jgi:hypothetical protein|nr:hypothetical protein [Candidatus Latescibacterota bacterium]